MTLFAYLTFYSVCMLNVVWGIRKKRSNALYALALIVIFILMAFNYRGPDVGAYIETYNMVGRTSGLRRAFKTVYMEYGYTFLMFCGNKIGLDFFAFRIILTIICLALFVSTLKYYKVNPNNIVGFYMLYLFFFDAIQLRNCIIQFIVLFASRYLFRKSWKSTLKYIACIVVACSIHTISWVFLSMLLIKFVRKNKSYRFIFGLSVVLFAVCLLLQPVFPSITNAISKYINRGSSYFHSTFRFNYWVIMALHLIGAIPLYRYRHTVEDPSAKRYIDGILKIAIILGLFLPFTFVNSNFNRIFRNFLILDTIGLTLLYEKGKKNSPATRWALSAQCVLVVGWLITDLFRNKNVNIIGFSMKYNLLFTKFAMMDLIKYVIVIELCLFIVFAVKDFIAYSHRRYGRAIRCV